ncbi:HU family DNA-binding protein [Streptomyces somaliensis]|uniref:HU family DNA-binding protein n=1 Tax=Streptomyces somaliensis TaxID=78355 RepID=UPI0020CC24F0|nr:HU family DNA-binding protein [Streptomyces somaliensis]MCP9946875.1 HU family DNA-binding protein [Streptomyces somaliensis]MCP9963513.1 HU family DNA-binding protein [Streptomyces somaliensis]MCP9976213.1 HU family DNA-binding protein [Streptomyces somaliensis]MCQ0025532.1 HU family DNA-binding protein [Streptomyces somaliensis DSM 40738]
MDRSELAEATARKTAERGGRVSADDVERVLEALFGTVTDAGALAEALRRDRTVSLMGFGSFHFEDGTAVLRPGQALNEYLKGDVG